MLSWLSSIGDSIGIFIQFLISVLGAILSVFRIMAQVVVFMATVWTILPPVLLVFAVCIFYFLIVLFIVGR